ncbi:hypothetical protein D6833_10090 [Candidatus Parcubacteria bacterium]|nr:MAG: hypothetical protein D6833_10090 [Candidatus Parcubacteria bacterium]
MKRQFKSLLDLAALGPSGLERPPDDCLRRLDDEREELLRAETDVNRAEEAGDMAYYAAIAWHNNALTLEKAKGVVQDAARVAGLTTQQVFEVARVKYRLRFVVYQCDKTRSHEAEWNAISALLDKWGDRHSGR